MTEVMPEAQKTAIAELLDYLKTNYYPNAKIVGHREIGSSDCPGKKFPLDELKNYKDILNKEDTEMTIEEKERMDAIDASLTRLYQIVTDLKTEMEDAKPMIYNYIDENMPQWAHEGVQWCVDNGIVQGTGDGLGLDDKDLKYCTIIMRVAKNLKLG